MDPIISARAAIEERLSRVVGQQGAKRVITENILGAVAQGGFSKPMLFVAPVGFGKSNLLDAIRDLNKSVLNRANIFFKSGKVVGTAKTFVEDVLAPHFGESRNLIIDEYQDAPRCVMGLLRDLITVKADRSANTITAPGDIEITYDPFMHGIVLGTNEIDKVSQALRSRCTEVVLSLYTDEQMEEILAQVMADSNIRFADGTLGMIASANRGTPRDIIHWSDAIRTTLAIRGKKELTKNTVKNILAAREVFPLGLNQREVAVLQMLETRGDMQLSELAGAFLCKASEAQAQEQYLTYRGLLGKNAKRTITKLGRAYLADLRRDGYIAA